MTLDYLDRQLADVRSTADWPDLPGDVWRRLASAIHGEFDALTDAEIDRLRLSTEIPPERYLEELSAFQAWMDFASIHSTSPPVVRAQVMTELYVAFVWLRDSFMRPASKILSDETAFAVVERFLRSGPRTRLRNAVAHGRWSYLEGFTGLEFWDRPSPGVRPKRFTISQADLSAWQALSRGTAIAALMGLTTRSPR